ncbi:Xylose isomerase-like TIM barrel [Rosistilla carotiformis]|uniref:Xylose isomerase-like TIM barrel n=1 Tax=Rosistilla carotiformis TaxID=2528017 RepID=A0A518JZ27_9BACT|nr:sugar phosphate isomerase/epimerase family protein [Rosistilla carotiformis]QDV70793.1 Xylose isomerase-like TIM barrel [Rosistilla carotiformis]
MHSSPTPVLPLLSRRQVLTSAIAASAVAGLAPRIASAAEVIPGREGPKFKFSLAAYSYRSLLQGKGDVPPAMDLLGFIDECAKMQLDGVELTSYYMPEEPTDAYLIGLRAHCFRQGLAVSGTAIRNDFGRSEGEARQRELAHVRRWIDHAAVLHAPMIRIFAGHGQKGDSPEKTHDLMVEGIQQSCDYAAKYGIYLALENHGGVTASSEGLLKLVRDVDSPWLGVNLDTGNFRFGGEPYEQMEDVAKYAVNVQVKVVVKDVDGNPQPMNFPRLKKILTDANYRGFVVLEYEEPGDVPAECRRYVEQMRTDLAL